MEHLGYLNKYGNESINSRYVSEAIKMLSINTEYGILEPVLPVSILKLIMYGIYNIWDSKINQNYLKTEEQFKLFH